MPGAPFASVAVVTLSGIVHAGAPTVRSVAVGSLTTSASPASSMSSPGGLPGLLGTSLQWSSDSQIIVGSPATGSASGFGGAGTKNV